MLGLAGALAAGQPAALAQTSPGSVFLSASSYQVNEDAGYVTITIERTNPATSEQVRFGSKNLGALDHLDYDGPTKTLVTFAPGQSTYSFNVPIHDLGMNAPPVRFQIYIFGAYSQPLGTPTKATVTINRNDPLQVRDTTNPLQAPTVSPIGNPLAGVTFFSAHSLAGDQVASVASNQHPAWRQPLSLLANAPTIRRFYMWNEPRYPASLVSGYLEKSEAAKPNTVVQLSTYSVVHGHCTGHWSDGPATVKRFQEFINGVARGIGNFRVAMWLELDSTITATPCLSSHGVHVRMHDELAYAVQALEKDPHVVVYLDAGAKDALDAATEARLLREADVTQAQGFFTNSTHFDWTTKEVAFAQDISRRLGGVHFIVSTGANGRGPKLNAHPITQGVEDLCNPAGRGLGPYTTQTGYLHDDALLWIGTPGNSSGPCRPGAPPTAVFWPSYAVNLVRNAEFKITGPKETLQRQGTFVNQYPAAIGN